ncbi:MAG: hypothetical protein BAJALOKI1v1_320009 [Promethearchaeota archaeon]|nr:MAG: hypothetical protein BAJALOKI1v1_320009 [Candidatus Lokiarchaeota archaeon]
MNQEKPKYGWYVKNLIITLLIFGILGISVFLFGLFSEGLLKFILVPIGIIIMVVCLWPGIGMTILNLTLGESFDVDKEMAAINELQSPQILDIGCGTGRTAIKIAKSLKNGGHLTGIDIYSRLAIGGNALQTVEHNAELENIAEKTTFQYGEATKIPFESEKFDIVNMSSVLHEIHNPDDQQKVLNEIYRVLKSNGVFYISEWNRNSWQLIAMMGIFSFVFKPKEYWLKLLESHGFAIENYNLKQGFGIFSVRKN